MFLYQKVPLGILSRGNVSHTARTRQSRCPLELGFLDVNLWRLDPFCTTLAFFIYRGYFSAWHNHIERIIFLSSCVCVWLEAMPFSCQQHPGSMATSKAGKVWGDTAKEPRLRGHGKTMGKLGENKSGSAFLDKSCFLISPITMPSSRRRIEGGSHALEGWTWACWNCTQFFRTCRAQCLKNLDGLHMKHKLCLSAFQLNCEQRRVASRSSTTANRTVRIEDFRWFYSRLRFIHVPPTNTVSSPIECSRVIPVVKTCWWTCSQRKVEHCLLKMWENDAQKQKKWYDDMGSAWINGTWPNVLSYSHWLYN